MKPPFLSTYPHLSSTINGRDAFGVVLDVVETGGIAKAPGLVDEAEFFPYAGAREAFAERVCLSSEFQGNDETPGFIDVPVFVADADAPETLDKAQSSFELGRDDHLPVLVDVAEFAVFLCGVRRAEFKGV